MAKSRAAMRDHVIESAIRLFSEHGFENVPFNDLSLASGVDKATIIRNFVSKDGIYDSIAGRFRQIHLDTEHLDSLLAGVGYDEGLVLLLNEYYRVFFEHIHYLRLYFMETATEDSRRVQWSLLEGMEAYLKSFVMIHDIKAFQEAVDLASALLVAFVAKCVWRANFVDGQWTCTDALRQEFTSLIQPMIDVFLMTLLPE